MLFHTAHACAGVPPPRMEWYKDAVPLSKLANPRYKISSATGLTVRRVQPGDGGIFQCFARNVAGEAQAHTQLLVSSESFPTMPSSHTPSPFRHHRFRMVNESCVWISHFRMQCNVWASLSPGCFPRLCLCLIVALCRLQWMSENHSPSIPLALPSALSSELAMFLFFALSLRFRCASQLRRAAI